MIAAKPLTEHIVLRCSNLGFKAGNTLLLQDVELAVRRGETLGIVGPNGSGKSTLLKLLGGLRIPSAGTLWLDEKKMQHWPRRHIARELAMVEQQADTDDAISVFDVVALGRTPWLSALHPWSQDEDAIVWQALRDVGAAHLGNRRWNSLSGGERQRVHIARALAQRPQILLLDEPGNHLDIQHQLDILQLVHDLPVTTLIALHDLNQALVCDRLAVLDRGRLVALGPPLEVLTPQCLLNTFGVRVHYLTDPFDGAVLLRFKQNDGGGLSLSQ
ncbi:MULTISPECIES: ABC transporter ATP-binding protein [unclassified Brenneria]|uniref:ABC transporter ATP-binding protein n=1 Tax=unclassified Brenneria TaxID=2634434 RepID=UPI001552DE0B|nr:MULTISPECIES: ABC transporter ATP-binding protein [unclassified Brenneria]MBJ7220808.1 ABC transporter ATP-binding protein [Brenneria sp. L3-3C-1]MEE3642048.1 ABC transporter ATP-binding protein [Brenneria sp. L3_3C_1]MEE3649255.1 ABC transporter ATP-binding protein [Brenneria sp. HEZEL_4_2_4]NPC99208.1 ABC transporter ATP-binding protein [Brenneria sp. hezel4-2-4]